MTKKSSERRLEKARGKAQTALELFDDAVYDVLLFVSENEDSYLSPEDISRYLHVRSVFELNAQANRGIIDSLSRLLESKFVEVYETNNGRKWKATD